MHLAITEHLASRVCRLFTSTVVSCTWLPVYSIRRGQMRVSLSEFRKHIPSIFCLFLQKIKAKKKANKKSFCLAAFVVVIACIVLISCCLWGAFNSRFCVNDVCIILGIYIYYILIYLFIEHL